MTETTREQLIKAREWFDTFEQCDCDDCLLNNCHKKTIRTLISNALEEPIEGWRPVDENTPKKGRYLGIINCANRGFPDVWGEPFVCEWDEEDGHICLHQTDLAPHKPTHWMPFPAARRQLNQGETK